MTTGWVFVTPTALFQLKEAQASLAWIGLDQVSGWEAVPNWSGLKLQVGTSQGAMQVTNVNERALYPFVHGLEAASHASGQALNPASLAAAYTAFDEVLELLENSWHLGFQQELGDVSAAAALAQDLLHAVAWCIRKNGGVTLDQAQLIFTLASMCGRVVPAGRGVTVRDIVDEVDGDPLPKMRIPSLGATALGQVDKWRDVVAGLGDVIEACKRTVPLGAPTSHGVRFSEVAAQVRGAVRPSGNLSGVDDVLCRLTGLVGIQSVKDEISNLGNLLRIQGIRQQQGLTVASLVHHLVFVGNPGTGKTTVARLIAELYRALGLLPSGHLVEASRQDLVAGYVGQTALKTAEVFDRARGGILFIDEAYALARAGDGQDYGAEAIDTLVKLMEDHREDTAVIVAGYPDEMARFVASNPGLASRFKRVIEFSDYDDVELLDILRHLALEQGYQLAQGARVAAQQRLATSPRGRGFGNGRLVRQLFEDALARQANRLVLAGAMDPAALNLLLAEDF